MRLEALKLFVALAPIVGAWALFWAIVRVFSWMVNPTRFQAVMSQKTALRRINDVVIPLGLAAWLLALALAALFPALAPPVR